MRKIYLLIALLQIMLLSCITSTNHRIKKVNADLLINNFKKYSNRNIEIEGYIIHICGVDGMKMKLRTEKGEIIKIVPFDSTLKFDKSYYHKTIRIQGKITEYKLEKHIVDSLEKEKTLLCHIDNTPCKDQKWVENQIRNGVSDSLSKKDVERLNKKMQQTGKNYISIYTIIAEKIIIKEE